jgi:hypothetical protein
MSGFKTATSAQELESSIQFPALVFSQNLLEVVGSMDEITQCSKLGFEEGFYKNMVLIDFNSKRFEVVGAEKVGRLPLRFRFRDFLGVVSGNPHWRVRLIFAPASFRISLDEIKNLILDSFEKEKYRWSEMTDFEEFRDKIVASGSLQQVFTILKEFHMA